MTRPSVLVVSPRPPRADGRGDQRRAQEIVAALSDEWKVEVLSWLPDVSDEHRKRPRPTELLRAAALATLMPAQVAYVQAMAPRNLSRRLKNHDAVLLVTDRAAPRRLPGASLVDFVDDIGGAALRRADRSRGAQATFWRLEGARLRRYDRQLVRAARLCVAHSPADSAGIDPTVQSIPLSIGTRSLPDTGRTVLFSGNLFYAPNHEASLWICTDLAPGLAARGIAPGNIVIAGRRPHPVLVQAAAEAGVQLHADVADLNAVLADAAVVLAPMAFGSGSQYKVLDAVGAGRPCVLSPVANAGLGLVDGQSALVSERAVGPFADAVASLLDDPLLRRRLVNAAQSQIAEYMPDRVAEAWRTRLREVVTSGETVGE